MPLRVWVTLLAALPAGIAFGLWGERLIARERRFLQWPMASARRSYIRGGFVALAFALLCGALEFANSSGWRGTPEVRPTDWGDACRTIYHQLLIGLLLVATVVDWDNYTIPDSITVPGTLLGIAGAGLIAHGQLIHLWVDWSAEVPGVSGPYLPAWLDAHRHLHGVAWSLAGLFTGGTLISVVRGLSTRLLGRETLGFGDVTVLAMIGSFLGWQPTICVFLLAPLLGLLLGIPLKLLTNKPYVPFGPFLGAAAVVVLLIWGPIWYRTRGIFGDWYGLLLLATMATLGLIALLTALLAYRRIPGRPGNS